MTGPIGEDKANLMTEATARKARPLSPHLGIYRWRVTMATSIVHRMSGVGLGLGAVFLVWWLFAAASGPEAYTAFHNAVAHPIGRTLLLGFTWALVFHTMNGVRHLAWDAGWGFALKTASFTGWLVIAGSVVVTLLVWFCGYQARGF